MPWNPSETEDREVRADSFTEVTVHAILLFFHVGIMISFAVELIGESQDVPGTIFNAEATPFAPLNIDMELSAWYFYFVYI